MSALKPIEAYRRANDEHRPQDIDALVERHAPLVRRIAYHLIARLPPSVDVEDLIQSGVIGLLEAARNYDGSQGASFETYAGIRIRGAMIDYMRPSDWTPRSVARKARELGNAIQSVERRQGREAKDNEIMQELGMDADSYHATLRDVAAARLLSFDALAGGDHSTFASGAVNHSGPETETTSAWFRHDLAQAIESLPEREGMVLSLYYDDELNLREIGRVLGVTESRVCQIHAKAVARLRSLLPGWFETVDPAATAE